MPYPTSYDDFAISGNPIRNDLVARLASLYDAVEAIEHELGINPSATYATVLLRLDAIQQQVNDLEADIPQQISDALAGHTGDTTPHAGFVGAIVTPSQANGGGKLFIGGSPSATGPDYDAWVDTSS